MNRSVALAAAIVFLASFCTLVIEIVAGRVLAPYVGVSLYTWTSIIGVVLAGISGGAYAGGWLADRRPSPSTLGWLLLASGMTAMLIAPATAWLASEDGVLTAFGIATTLLARVVLLSFLLFFLPSFFLGMISPVAVKLAVRDLATAGRVVGKIYAFSTLGSIAGTFVTGFWLVARFGTRATLIGVGVVLLASAFLLGNLFGRTGRAAAILLLALGAAYAGLWPGALPPPGQKTLLQPLGGGTLHFEESRYYTIAVERTIRDDNGAPLHALHLDHLVHSYADPDDPTFLEYEYLRVFHDVAAAMLRTRARPRFLFIGGGGYTLPRLLARSDAEMHVVEIDPAVTRVARRFFGIPRNAPIRTFHEDARWFALRHARNGHEPYDAIFVDAFNDLSVPYHLTTREFALLLQRLVHPDGAVVVNVIDDYQRGRFLPSYLRTLQSVFGADAVRLVLESDADRTSARSTFVVVASRAPVPFATARPLADDELRRYLAERSPMILTDDHAPVDYMLAPLFTERFVDELQDE